MDVPVGAHHQGIGAGQTAEDHAPDEGPVDPAPLEVVAGGEGGLVPQADVASRPTRQRLRTTVSIVVGVLALAAFVALIASKTASLSAKPRAIGLGNPYRLPAM